MLVYQRVTGLSKGFLMLAKQLPMVYIWDRAMGVFYMNGSWDWTDEQIRLVYHGDILGIFIEIQGRCIHKQRRLGFDIC